MSCLADSEGGPGDVFGEDCYSDLPDLASAYPLRQMHSAGSKTVETVQDFLSSSNHSFSENDRMIGLLMMMEKCL